MNTWHPWRWIGTHYPDIRVDCTRRLTGGALGLTGGRTVWLHPTQDQAQRRTSLTHEICHIEMPDATEDEVERETARRLITLEQIIDAFQWFRHPTIEELADHWWVDKQAAHTRMINLDPIEVAQIEAACDGDWCWTAPDEESA